jgi:hypothetical protein
MEWKEIATPQKTEQKLFLVKTNLLAKKEVVSIKK